MKRLGILPELLAPAGSYEALFAAVAAGADAVYLGGKAFGARAYAQNFDNDALADAIRYAHLHGVKIYVTVNTLLWDRELSDALAFCRELYRLGADAVITADLGLIRLLRSALPDLEIHASTQLSAHNRAGADAAAALGATRVVLARELALSDIRHAVECGVPEVEVFLHGALCVCHSGQCLFSSLVGGRSGNRGECAQPCRLPYNGRNRYPLSLCDLSLASHIRELIESGVASLKIEGRMKSPDYVYAVTSVYRRLLDEGRDATAGETHRLTEVFSRGGFTDGYFAGHPERRMTGIRSEADKDLTRSLEKQSFAPRRVSVCAEASFLADQPSSMTIFREGKSVTVFGDTPVPALNAPLNASDLTTRLCKMGNTYLDLRPEDLKIRLDDGLNLSPGAINALRRKAADAFMSCEREMPKRCDGGHSPTAGQGMENLSATTTQASEGLPATAAQASERLSATAGQGIRSALFYDSDVLCKVAKQAQSFFDRIFVPLWRYEPGQEAACGVALPPVVMDREWERVRQMVERAAKSGVRYAMMENISHLALIRGTGLTPVGGFRLNVTNGESAAAWRAWGVSDLILSPELTLPMLRDIGGSAIVYGRIPLMITERCFVKENGGCDRCGRFELTDRIGKKFPILREFEHRNLILNAVATYMGDRKRDLFAYGVRGEHFIFTVETAHEVRAVLDAYRDGLPLPGETRKIRK